MSTLDLIVLVAYLGGIVAFGVRVSRAQRTVHDYFVTGNELPWWAIMGSIVATETSTVTFISIPGFAYAANFTFLQLVTGYLVGRVGVAVIFIPAYFRGELLTAYQLLGERFGTGVKRFASALFLVTRSLADGFRLFATGLVLAAVLATLPGAGDVSIAGLAPETTMLAAAVLAIGGATIVYTYLGGMRAVIWTDVIQLVVYLAGAVVAAVILLDRIPGGWSEVARVGSAAGRFRLFDFSFDVTRGYTFWSGVVGGAFLTTATHGTDQLMVQRYLCARSAGDARKALLWSGAIVFAQFALFLLIGAMLFVYYTGHAPQEIAAFTGAAGVQGDRVFPYFIVNHLPAGVLGLVLAAIFAAAMSTLSSSLNSSSAALVGDFYLPLTGPRRSARHDLRVSRLATAGWGVVQIVVAISALKLSSRVVDEVLGIASFTNGVILGLFFLGTFTRRVASRDALAGAAAGAGVMLAVKLFTAVTWQWYVLVGSLVTLGVGVAASYVLRRESRRLRP